MKVNVLIVLQKLEKMQYLVFKYADSFQASTRGYCRALHTNEP